MDELAVRIGKDLHFDVLGPRDVALEKHLGLTEGGRCLAHRLGNLLDEFFGRRGHANAATAAAKTRFDHERKSKLLPERRHVVTLADRGLGARHGRHTYRLRQLPRGDLVAKGLEVTSGGTDEADACLFARSRQSRVLGEKPVARVNGISAAAGRDGHDLIDVEIRAHRLAAQRWTDCVGLVRLESM